LVSGRAATAGAWVAYRAMVCPNCHAALDDGAEACPSCAATQPASPGPAPSSAPAATNQLRTQLEGARRSLPFGSIHLAAAGFAVAALLLSFTSWGARPAWWLTLLTLAGIGAVAAADLRARGAFQVASWPLSERRQRLLAAATAILLASTALISLHVLLGSLMWLLALACFAWGVWPDLKEYVDVRPKRLLGGYRLLAVGGVVVLLAALTQNAGQGSSSLLPGYGYGCSLSGCGYGVNYGFGAVTVFGVIYQGVAIEWAEFVVVALFAGLAALLCAGDWRPAWLRRVPLATAALAIAWLVWAMLGSVLAKAGSKQLAWWVAIVALAAYAVGSAFIAAGQEDGDYAPGRLARRLRGAEPAR